MKSSARTWFSRLSDLQRLVDEAVAGAKMEKGKVFAEHMQLCVKRYGRDVYLSEDQLKWLCYLADWDLPKRLF